VIEATPNGATPLVAYPIPQCTANFATHALPAGQVRVIKPHNLWNTDDTTVLVSENSSSAAGPKWRIAKGNEATGVQSLYKMGEGSGFLSCMRVRATVSAAANGSTSPLYLTVTGLTEAELPIDKVPSGVLICPVPGLCIGGGGTDTRARQLGCVNTPSPTRPFQIRPLLALEPPPFLSHPLPTPTITAILVTPP